MRLLRRVHVLLGLFFAPTIVFFALTGALQAAGLHERREGRTPPSWILHVAEVHKHQRWEPRRRPTPPPSASATVGASASPGAAAPASVGRTLLRVFAVLLSLGLAATTLLGIWMGWQVRRDRKLVVALVVLGALVPAAFLFF